MVNTPAGVDLAGCVARNEYGAVIPGVSLAFGGGGDVTTLTWGVRRVPGGEPVTPDTRFQAASVSKPVAAFGALRLVAQGLLDLDDDVVPRLGRWQPPPRDGEAGTPRITLRQLLSHTAGLTVHGFPGYGPGEDVPDTAGVLRGAGTTPAVECDLRPGRQFRYSGGGYTVLQLLMEEATRTPFAQLMRELVLEPAGMTTASFEQPPGSATSVDAAHAHDPDGTPAPWRVYAELAAAGLWCTPTDLVRFGDAVRAAVDRGPRTLLPPDLADAFSLPHVPVSDDPEDGTWGLGPGVDGTGPSRMLGHGGANAGYRSRWHLHLDRGTLAVMSNSDAAYGLLVEIAEELSRSW